MQRITQLNNYGSGKRALIIGNGPSINNTDFTGIDRDRFVIFGINHFQQPVKPDFIIYYDTHVYGKRPSDYYKTLPEDIKLISFDLSKCDRTDYWYSNKNSHGIGEGDIIFQDSGGHMVQIASNIMNFDEIYLIGFDYHDGSGYLRFIDKKKATDKEMERYEKAIFSRALHKYTYPKCIHADLNFCNCKPENIYKCDKIFNCTENSALTRFPYKNITEVINGRTSTSCG